MKDLKFTQEIKDQWLAVLKSGKYTQCTRKLETCGKHCCIGVLGDIHPDLHNDCVDKSKMNPYEFLEMTTSHDKMEKLWKVNDNTFHEGRPDYSNVIHLIERLKTNDL